MREFLNRILDGRDSILGSEIEVVTVDDFILFQRLRDVPFMFDALLNREFSVTPLGVRAENEWLDFPDFTLARVRKGILRAQASVRPEGHLDPRPPIGSTARDGQSPGVTKRETPLKIAIEMANVAAVDRLIELGADVEAPSCYNKSALCYAMILLHMSLHPQDRTQEMMYFAGKGPPEAYDAKDGAVLDADLAARRMAMFGAIHASPIGQALWDGIKGYYIRPVADCKAVIRTLLKHGADANCRYKVEAHHLAEWTPTLFAAEVGDVGIFEALVEGGGDPHLTLLESSSLERYDALWVAVNHKRDAIVRFLMAAEQRR